jgi:alcohol dehydrogenase class IV
MKYPDIKYDPYFTFFNRPQIVCKPGARGDLEDMMTGLGGKRVLVYTDQGLVKAGVADMVIDQIKASSKLELAGVFDKIVQDARLDLINEGAAFYRKCGADCMVAVGGGSVMDSAKAINILIGEGLDDFTPLKEQCALMDGAKPLPPHIAFPTTSGTGAEVTFILVVLDPVAKSKSGCVHPYCGSDIAMLDPELTVALPARLTASTSMDALTHAIECYTSTVANPVSDGLALHAMRLIAKFLPLTIQDLRNVEYRENLQIASTMAIIAFVNAIAGTVHAIAHSLGGLYGVPHGDGNGIMLPHVMEFNRETCPERFMMMADALGVDIHGMTVEDAGKAAVQAVRDLQKKIGFTQTLKDFGVPATREGQTAIVELTMMDGAIGTNARQTEEEDVYNLIAKAM